MKKSLYSITLLVVMAVFSLELTSCKDDEPEKFTLKVSNPTQAAKESDFSIEIEISLDKPAPEDITVKFKLTGTAYDDVRAQAENEYADFEVDGDYDKIVIAKGETSATIKLTPYSDSDLEDDETIIVTLTEVKNANVILDSSPVSTVTLGQEDGMIVYLVWPASSSANGVVDMDMLVRIGASAASYDRIIAGSIFPGFDRNFELVFIPKTFVGTLFGYDYSNSTYGLTYTYYDGTRNDLTFTVTFAELINGEIEAEASQQDFTNAVSYTTDNINKWEGSAYPTIIAQTFSNVGGVYQNFSEIVTPESSSRTGIATSNEFVGNLFNNAKTRREIKNHVLPEKYLNHFKVK